LNKVIYIDAHFKPIGKVRTYKVPTGEKKKGVFGGEKDVLRKEKKWEQTGWSDKEIDGERLAQDIEVAIDGLNSNGYEVVTISETISGNYDYSHKSGGINNGGFGYGYGFGYSYTEGVTIIAKKIL
jgi:hypothetical protein